jgi:starch phosphorylase
VRMAHLAAVGSKPSTASPRCTRSCSSTVMRDFHELWPEKFSNVTNGVTPRRFIVLSNPDLAALITETSASAGCATWPPEGSWSPRRGRRTAGAMAPGQAGRQAGPQRLARTHRRGADPRPCSTCQAKRIHEYKRQHLNLLRRLALRASQAEPQPRDGAPRTFSSAARRPPLLHRQADHQAHQRRRRHVVNNDPQVDGRCGRFMPDFNVKNGGAAVPGRRSLRADLHGRQGGERHRQHEVLDERRADHRHARRRQRRDPRRGRPRQLLPVRADRPRSSNARPRATIPGRSTRPTSSCAPPST